MQKAAAIVKYELQMWVYAFLTSIPGRIGCWVRGRVLPVTVGKAVTIWNGVHIDYPSRLFVGSNTSINRGGIINAAGRITIGNDVLIGPNVVIYSQNHNFTKHGVLIRKQGYKEGNVEIGNNIWIASCVTILPGVTIGDGAVIAAGSVVTNNLKGGALYGGVPAKLIKELSC